MMKDKEMADTTLKPKGMYNKSNPGESGVKISKGSVNDSSTRKGVAPTPKTLGPRTA